MSYIFVSHASADKLTRVRPLVEALIDEGEAVWVDRAGAGTHNLGLSQEYISRNPIHQIEFGNAWPASIVEALNQASAVIGCITKNLTQDRLVLQQEFAIAMAQKKLIPCILDDISREEVRNISSGLVTLDLMQTVTIDPLVLNSASPAMGMSGLSSETRLPEREIEREKVRNLISAVNRVRTEPRSLTRTEMDRVVPILKSLPIGPVLRVSEVPHEFLEALAEYADTSERAKALIDQANLLISAATVNVDDISPEIAPKLQLRRTNLPAFGSLSQINYWREVVREAGMRSRKTVAAVLLNPLSQWAFGRMGLEQQAWRFSLSLRNNL